MATTAGEKVIVSAQIPLDLRVGLWPPTATAPSPPKYGARSPPTCTSTPTTAHAARHDTPPEALP
jgi:hypothetical protein